MGRTIRTAKDAGTRFETYTARYLDSVLPDHVEKRRLAGSNDMGDLSGVRTSGGMDVAVECKDYGGRYAGLLPGWVDEANAEARNAGADVGVVVFKRKGCGEASMGRQFVAMDLESFARLIAGKKF